VRNRSIVQLPNEVWSAELLEAIKQRVADGIMLGGNFTRLFDEYVITHRDRCALLARVIELERGIR
jgi:hypothetical protein